MPEYIDKNKLLQALKKMEDVRDCISFVEQTPKASVAVISEGKWLIESTQITKAVCSACGTNYQEYYKHFRYCPRCGAKMDEV